MTCEKTQPERRHRRHNIESMEMHTYVTLRSKDSTPDRWLVRISVGDTRAHSSALLLHSRLDGLEHARIRSHRPLVGCPCPRTAASSSSSNGGQKAARF